MGQGAAGRQEDEEEPLAHLMPPGLDFDDTTTRARRTRIYAFAAIAVGLLATLIGLASGVSRWSMVLVGLLMVAAGTYSLITLRHRHP